MIATLVCGKNATAQPVKAFQTETFDARKSRRRDRRRELPSAGWNLPALVAAAKREHARIGRNETAVPANYWRLGRALNLIREKKRFARGEWQPWLARHKIVKVRAFRARLLARTFLSINELNGLTLEEALQAAGGRTPQSADRLARIGQQRADLLAHADGLAQALDYFRRACAASKLDPKS